MLVDLIAPQIQAANDRITKLERACAMMPTPDLQAQLAQARTHLARLEASREMVAPPPTQEDHAEAWAFVLQYGTVLANLTRRHAVYMPPEDFLQELKLRVVTRYPQLRAYLATHPIKSQRATEIHWLETQAQATKTATKKKLRWREQMAAVEMPEVAVLDRDRVEVEEALTKVRKLMEIATPDQQEAMLRYLDPSRGRLSSTQRERAFAGLRERWTG